MQQQTSMPRRLGRFNKSADPADVAEDELGDVQVHVTFAAGEQADAPGDRIAVGDVDLAREPEPSRVGRARDNKLLVRVNGFDAKQRIHQIVDVDSLPSPRGPAVAPRVRTPHSHSRTRAWSWLPDRSCSARR